MQKKHPAPEKWLKIALEEAQFAAQEDEVPVGAVVVKDGKIIAREHNRREQNQDPLGHAETLTIAKAAHELGNWRLEGCQLFVTLEPCPMCLAAAQQARIESIIYGAQDPKGGALSLGYSLHSDDRTNHRFTVELHPMKECSSILSDFFKQKRKK